MIYTKEDRTISVRNGFSFWAFVFAWGWLLSRGLWLHSLLVILIYIPIYFFHSIAMAFITSSLKLPEYYYLVPTLVLVTIHLYVGFKGTQWQRTALLNKGYKNAG